MPKKPRKKLTRLERAINAKKACIERQNKAIQTIYAQAEERAQKIKKNMEKARVLLRALESGELTP